VVVLDDASSDSTGVLARSWSFDRRFRYVQNERNLGRVGNYRRGLTEVARGDWVLMLDGDDFLEGPDVIRRFTEAIDRHCDRPIMFAQAGHRVHFLNGSQPDIDVVPKISSDVELIAGGDYLGFVFDTAFFSHLGTLFNRRRAIEVGAYTADLSSSDMDSLLRLALEGEVLLVRSLAGNWVQHGANASSNVRLEQLAANVRLFRRIARQAVRRGLTTWDTISGPLLRYEAITLGYLFDTMLGKAVTRPMDFVRYLAISLAVSPALLRHEHFRRDARRFAKILVKPTLERRRFGRFVLSLARVANSSLRGFSGRPA
jgi:glycosyltransferase involved in cell wall biosynthesis